MDDESRRSIEDIFDFVVYLTIEAEEEFEQGCRSRIAPRTLFVAEPGRFKREWFERM